MPMAAPVTTAVRPSRENAATRSSWSGCTCLAAASRSPEIMSIGSGLDGRVDAVAALLELGDDVLGEDLEVAHDLLVGEVAELHVAEQLVDADLVVADDLLEALLGGADDDHVLVLVV